MARSVTGKGYSNRMTTSKTPAKKGGRRLRSMTIRRAKGGHIADHDYEGEDGMYMPGEQHIVTGGGKALAQHVAKHFGGDDEESPELPDSTPKGARGNRQEAFEQA